MKRGGDVGVAWVFVEDDALDVRLDLLAPAHREDARDEGTSLNQVLLDALTAGSGVRREFHDLDFMIGSMTPDEAERIDEEVSVQRRIDPRPWK